MYIAICWESCSPRRRLQGLHTVQGLTGVQGLFLANQLPVGSRGVIGVRRRKVS